MVIVFRTLAILLAIAIMLSGALYVLSGDRRYLVWAVRLLKVGVAGGLVFFGVLLLERIV